MENLVKWQKNALPQSNCAQNLELMSVTEIQKVRNFHKSFPQYRETPLTRLGSLASYMGLGGFYVKDESYRFGLNAFKVLGGSFAMAKYIAQRLGQDIEALGYDRLISDETREKLGQATFFTATDGNHGRGVAWAANQMKQKSVVYMPKGSSQTRLDNILKEGSNASITDMNYDDAVRLAFEESKKVENGVMVQDTAWEGYEEIPGWIMQGYGTMALEADEQLKKLDVDRPTHVFVQAGVGSLAGAVQGFFKNRYPENPPIVTVVEASAADCLYKSAVAGDGKIRIVGGDLFTIMAGLACGEPNTISWEILKNYTSCFVSAEDYVSAEGMRILSSPCGNDPRVISGESGAVTTGLVFEIMTNPALAELKSELKLDSNSQVLVFSTEGDTDPEKYLDIVWKGAND